MNRRILIVSEPFGMGHTMVANALKELIVTEHADWQVEVLELSRIFRPTVSQLLASLYLQTLKYSPSLWGTIYRRSQHKQMHHKLKFLLQHALYKRIDRLIQNYVPDLVISTHPFPSAVIARLKENGMQINLCTVVTDYGVHGAWVNDQVDHYFLPTNDVRLEYVRLGVAEEKMFVTGIPTHPKFYRKLDQAEVRSKLGLKDMPTILCMGGGLGVGFQESMINTLVRYTDQIQVLLVTGKNIELYEAVKENKRFNHPNFHAYSFVNNIDELMDASDFMITKPGGVTCSEAIHKKLPMLLMNPLPGQEEENLVFMVENNYGMFLSDNNTLAILLQQIVDSPESLQAKFYRGKEHVTESDRILEWIDAIS